MFKNHGWCSFKLMGCGALVAAVGGVGVSPASALWSRADAEITFTQDLADTANLAQYMVSGFERQDSALLDGVPFSYPIGDNKSDSGKGLAQVNNTSRKNLQRWLALEFPESGEMRDRLSEIRGVDVEMGDGPIVFPFSARSQTEADSVSLQVSSGLLLEEIFKRTPDSDDGDEDGSGAGFERFLTHFMAGKSTATALVVLPQPDEQQEPVMISEISVTLDAMSFTGEAVLGEDGLRLTAADAWQSVQLEIGELGVVLDGSFVVFDNGELDATGDISVENGQFVVNKVFESPLALSPEDLESGLLKLELRTEGFIPDQPSAIEEVLETPFQQPLPEPTGLTLVALGSAALMSIRSRKQAAE